MMYNKVKNKEGKPYKPERITGMKKVLSIREIIRLWKIGRTTGFVWIGED